MNVFMFVLVFIAALASATMQGNSCVINNMYYGFVIGADKCASKFLCINFNQEGEPNSDCCGSSITRCN